MELQVTCSTKDQDGDIIGIGGYQWSHPKAEAVAAIRRGLHSYFVVVNGQRVFVRVGTRNYNDYLTTSPDGYQPNNLDSLPSC